MPPRRQTFLMRLSDAECLWLKREAENMGISRPDFVRRKVFADQPFVTRPMLRERLPHRFQITLSTAEYQRLKEEAQKFDLAMTDYVRQRVFPQ